MSNTVIAAIKEASALTVDDVILHMGQRLRVRAIEPTHKDGLLIRLRGHEPIQVSSWNAQIWVEVQRCICARCAKYDGCPNAAPAPDDDISGYEGICTDCRENRRHLGHTPETMETYLLVCVDPKLRKKEIDQKPEWARENDADAYGVIAEVVTAEQLRKKRDSWTSAAFYVINNKFEKIPIPSVCSSSGADALAQADEEEV